MHKSQKLVHYGKIKNNSIISISHIGNPHGSDTALLSLTDQLKKELENHNNIGLISMDLPKTIDTLPHD